MNLTCTPSQMCALCQRLGRSKVYKVYAARMAASNPTASYSFNSAEETESHINQKGLSRAKSSVSGPRGVRWFHVSARLHALAIQGALYKPLCSAFACLFSAAYTSLVRRRAALWWRADV